MTTTSQFCDRLTAAITARLPRHTVRVIDEPETNAVRFDVGIRSGASGTVSLEELLRAPSDALTERTAAIAVGVIERDALDTFGPMIEERERGLRRQVAELTEAHQSSSQVLGDIVVAYALASSNPKLFAMQVERILFESRTK